MGEKYCVGTVILQVAHLYWASEVGNIDAGGTQ